MYMSEKMTTKINMKKPSTTKTHLLYSSNDDAKTMCYMQTYSRIGRPLLNKQ